MKRLKINFIPSNNFGDALNQYILFKKNIPFHYCHHEIENKITLVGSTLTHHLSKNTHVFGNGVISRTQKLRHGLVYNVVRGPLTKKVLEESGIDVGEVVYGDPALLLPSMYNNKNIKKKYKLGIIPHQIEYHDMVSFVKQHEEHFRDTIILNTTTPTAKKMERFIDDILSCEKIISSSLHGIITSHAYQVPCLWLHFSDKLWGDGIKFRDYFASVGVNDIEPIKMIKTQNITIDNYIPTLCLETLENNMPWNKQLPDCFYEDDEDPQFYLKINDQKIPIRARDYWKDFSLEFSQ
jgi:hypothetical protein